MAANEIRAGGAFIQIYTKGKEQVDAQLKGVGSSLSRLKMVGAGLQAVGTAAVGLSTAVLGGLGAAFASFVSQADGLSDMAARTGATTDRLQELSFAASQAGASIEDVERAMITAQKKGLDFEKTAATIGKIEDATKRNQAAFAAFGKSGVRIAPMLSDLPEQSARAHSLGLVQDPADIAAGGRLADMWATITQQARALVSTVGAALAPAMEKLFSAFSRVLSVSIKFISENQGLIQGIGIAASVIVGLGAAFAGVSAAAAFLATPLGMVVGVILAVGAAVGGAVAAFLYFNETGRSAFNAIWESASKALGGIVDALMGGKIGLAFKIAWTAALLAFETFRANLMNSLVEMVNDIVKAAFGLGKSMAKGLQDGLRGGLNFDFNKALKQLMDDIGNPQKHAQRLQKELDKLVAEAAALRGPGANPLGRVRGSDYLKNAAAGGSGQFGTFSAAIATMAGRTGTLTVQEKQLEKLGEMDDKLGKILKEAEEGGLVFA